MPYAFVIATQSNCYPYTPTLQGSWFQLQIIYRGVGQKYISLIIFSIIIE